MVITKYFWRGVIRVPAAPERNFDSLIKKMTRYLLVWEIILFEKKSVLVILLFYKALKILDIPRKCT